MVAEPQLVCDELTAGSTIGDYRIVDVIGRGGMGTVYRASRLPQGDEVAIKVLGFAALCDALMVQRFIDEAALANRVRHRNVGEVFGCGRLHNGVPYLVMELLDGETLKQRVAARGRLPLDEVRRVARAVGAGLDAVHRQGIVHRDVKPDNVFLTRQGTVKLIDFGIAKLRDGQLRDGELQTRSGYMPGTPAYMAPEQCRGRTVDHRVDVYALGLVLYELLVGRRAFTAQNIGDLLLLQQSLDPTPPSVYLSVPTPQLDEALLRALAKDPADRFASAGALVEAVCLALDQTERAFGSAWHEEVGNAPTLREPIPTTTAAPSPQSTVTFTPAASPRPGGRPLLARLALIASALAALAVIGAVALSGGSARDRRAARDQRRGERAVAPAAPAAASTAASAAARSQPPLTKAAPAASAAAPAASDAGARAQHHTPAHNTGGAQAAAAAPRSARGAHHARGTRRRRRHRRAQPHHGARRRVDVVPDMPVRF